MDQPIINKVAQSELITLDLQQFIPEEATLLFDLKDYLFMGLILKEKDFREALKKKDFSEYAGKTVAITCSADAIIPMWAYMLVMTYLQPIAAEVIAGNEADLQRHLFLKNLHAFDVEQFRDKRLVIKGCGDRAVAEFAYAEITRVLLPLVKSLMYGEPCSTVPVFKRKA